jgi:aldose 1-epimerase
MKYSYFLLAAAASAAAGPHKPKPQPDKDGKYTLKAPGITAQFIPYAATLTNLWVKGNLP